VACRPELLLERLWQRLQPQRWPLPLAALPAGTALVGGAVRDALLGRLGDQPDLDLVVPDQAVALAGRLARRLGGSRVVLDAERDMARLVLQGWTIDLARCLGPSLADDLARRDYRANAIALLLPDSGEGRPRLLDPQGGVADLKTRRLTAISEANLLDDPLRLLRGVRLAAELEGELEPRTRGWLAQHHGRLASVAPERVLAELERLAAAPGGQQGLAELAAQGWLAPWGAAVPGAAERLADLTVERAAAAGLSPEDIATALPLARLAALCGPQVLARLHASRRLQQRSQQLEQAWQRCQQLDGSADPAQLPEAERLALHRSLAADLPALLLQLPPAVAQPLLQRWRDPLDPLCHPRPPLDGRALQAALALTPGPRLGRLLDHLTAERAFGRLPPGAAEAPAALAAARRWLEANPQPPLEGRRG